jgi:hypothetical protein
MDMDSETKNMIVSLCEVLREQIQQHAEMERALVCMIKTAAQSDASFLDKFKAHMETMDLGSNRDAAVKARNALVQIGRIIQHFKG